MYKNRRMMGSFTFNFNQKKKLISSMLLLYLAIPLLCFSYMWQYVIVLGCSSRLFPSLFLPCAVPGKQLGAVSCVHQLAPDVLLIQFWVCYHIGTLIKYGWMCILLFYSIPALGHSKLESVNDNGWADDDRICENSLKWPVWKGVLWLLLEFYSIG